MTEPSQYFKGRTVQEQMDEVIGYVDKRAEEVAAAKADAVLQPAEEAKTAAQAAAEAAEAAKNATIAALPEIRQDISGLKAEDAALDGRLDSVELKVTTAEGNIVTIQGQITALQTADGQNVKLTGDQTIDGVKTFTSSPVVPTATTGTADAKAANGTKVKNELDNYTPMVRTTGSQTIGGVKKFKNGVDGLDYHYSANTNNEKDNAWRDSLTFPYVDNHIMIVRLFSGFNNDDTQNATIKIRMRANTVSCIVIETAGTIESMAKASNYVAVYDGENVTLKTKKIHQYTNLFIKMESWGSYGYASTMPDVTYPNADCNDPSTETFVSISVGAIVPYRNVN